jgi:hypothetical protein
VLVFDLTDDLFEDVLDGDHAGHPAVLVDDDREVVAARAEVLEQGIEALALGNEDRRSQHVAHAEAAAVTEREQVLGQQDADHLVAAVADHREARVPRLEGDADQFLRRIIAADHDHLRARDHDVVDTHLGDLEHPLDHLQGTPWIICRASWSRSSRWWASRSSSNSCSRYSGSPRSA